MTDLPAIVPNLGRNAAFNESAISEHGGSVKTDVLDWSSMGPGPGYDLVIAADPLYEPEHPVWLAQAIDGRLGRGEGARAVVGFPLRDETTKGFGEVLRVELRGRGFEIVREGDEEGFDDWEVNGERARVHCWWGVWARKGGCWGGLVGDGGNRP